MQLVSIFAQFAKYGVKNSKINDLFMMMLAWCCFVWQQSISGGQMSFRMLEK